MSTNQEVAELRAVINDMCMVANVASGWNKVTNAQVAQLREAINNIGFELDYLSSGVAEKLNRAMSTSSDTWLAEHDREVEVKVLDEHFSNNHDATEAYENILDSRIWK